MQDLGPPIAWLVLEEGTPVYDRNSERVGVAERALGEGDIFEGLIVHTLPLPGHHLFADADQIAQLHERGVVLSVERDGLHEPPPEDSAPAGAAVPEATRRRVGSRRGCAVPGTGSPTADSDQPGGWTKDEGSDRIRSSRPPPRTEETRMANDNVELVQRAYEAFGPSGRHPGGDGRVCSRHHLEGPNRRASRRPGQGARGGGPLLRASREHVGGLRPGLQGLRRLRRPGMRDRPGDGRFNGAQTGYGFVHCWTIQDGVCTDFDDIVDPAPELLER